MTSLADRHPDMPVTAEDALRALDEAIAMLCAQRAALDRQILDAETNRRRLLSDLVRENRAMVRTSAERRVRRAEVKLARAVGGVR